MTTWCESNLAPVFRLAGGCGLYLEPARKNDGALLGARQKEHANTAKSPPRSSGESFIPRQTFTTAK
jgi:hypothetical protein